MNKLIDEYDVEIFPKEEVTAIDVYGVKLDEHGYCLRHEEADFFSVYRIEGGRHIPVGDFSDVEDALAYAYRLCEKYGVELEKAEFVA